MSYLIGDIISGVAATDPELAAATLEKDSVSFDQLDRAANRFARGLRRTGVRTGDLVAWWSGLSLDTLTVMIGCAKAGAVFAPISPRLGDEEVEEVLGYMNPALIVAESALLSRVDGVDLCTVIAAEDDAALEIPDLSDHDPHILYLTSGSTGRSKGVLVSHRASWLRSRRGHGSLGDDVTGVLCAFPLFHYAGWQFVLEAWLTGATSNLVARADGGLLVAAIERHRPQAVYAIPAVWERMLAEPGDLSSVRYADTGTSAVSPDLLRRIAERLPGARTAIFYGSSEAGRISALWDQDLDGRADSVGLELPPGRVSLADDGEILFTGPTVMNGYLDLPEATGQALDGGWYHTGDLGTQDEDGFIRITGRKREVIRSGGETISPSEVETALGAVPGTSEIAIVGLPDDTWGEVICAVVVLDGGATVPAPEDLRARLAALAPHKHPRLVVAVDSIPRTAATGQVRRGPLRETVQSMLASSTADAS